MPKINPSARKNAANFPVRTRTSKPIELGSALGLSRKAVGMAENGSKGGSQHSIGGLLAPRLPAIVNAKKTLMK